MTVALIALLLAQPSGPRCEHVENGFGPKGTVSVRAETVVSGLEVPWSLAFLPNGDWLVTERPGRLRRVHAGHMDPKPVAEVPIGNTSEGGLLGLALDPDFSRNHFIYFYVTVEREGRPENQVQRWVLAEDGTTAHSDKVILQGLAASPFHNGGRLRFGPDGMLYVGVGDARHPEWAQDPKRLNGKLLRITRDGSAPKDNPFGNPVFLLGVRNTEGFDWADPKTLWVTDHGPSGEYKGWTGADEVDVAHAGDNLGWPKTHLCDEGPGLITPVLTWTQGVPPGGALIYRGDKIPEWKGSLLIGSLGAKHLHRVKLRPDGTVAAHEVYFEGDPPTGWGRLRDVVLGPDGELYVTTSNCDGRGRCPKDKDRILRIIPQK